MRRIAAIDSVVGTLTSCGNWASTPIRVRSAVRVLSIGEAEES